ncbi:MAG: hypothetical protein KME22_06565 [Hassallia sp. WJT32-NPBG1]|jgi:hypothetical protein|nr:hypothetical protein [Hassallia sp. WJT32-NPBG1]
MQINLNTLGFLNNFQIISAIAKLSAFVLFFDIIEQKKVRDRTQNENVIAPTTKSAIALNSNAVLARCQIKYTRCF